MSLLPSRLRIHSYIAARFSLTPDSLPRDHRMIDGWFLSRSIVRAARSRMASRQAGSALGLPRQPTFSKPWVSRSHSSITQRPYSSHKSRKSVCGG